MPWITGNAADDGREFKGWFVGQLTDWSRERGIVAPRDFGLLESDMVEIKWSAHPAGESRPAWAECSDKVSLSLLVSGRFLLRFRAPGTRHEISEQRLEKPGDYALWGRDLEHTWTVEEDSVIMTVRWRGR